MRRVSRRGRDAVCGSLRSDNNVAQVHLFTKHQPARTWVPQDWIFTGAPSDRSSSLGWSETSESNEPNLQDSTCTFSQSSGHLGITTLAAPTHITQQHAPHRARSTIGCAKSYFLCGSCAPDPRRNHSCLCPLGNAR